MIERGALDALVIVVRNADKHRDVAPLFKIEHEPGVLDRLPRGFQHQPVLRIDKRRLARRDAKELRIKLIDLIEESATFRIGLSRNSLLPIVISLHVPPIRGHIGQRFAAFDEHLPEGLCVIDTAWKAAADSDDGDAIFWHKRNGSARTLVPADKGFELANQAFLRKVLSQFER